MNYNHIDHLLYGGPNLTLVSQQVEQQLGIAPITGGSHPGKGTRNEILGLSHGAYLEMIGPDPTQSVDQVWMNIDQFTSPKLFRWAAKGSNLDALRGKALTKGIDIGAIQSGQRQKPDGSLLKWHLTNPDVLLCDGLIPFFIDWGEAGNPAPSLPFAGELIEFYGTHPYPAEVEKILAALNLEMEVKQSAHIGLVAKLNVNGQVIELK